MKRHPVFEGVEMGVGTAAWGDRLMWGYRRDYQDEDLKLATEVSLAHGINFFDTAEIYGSGRAETLLGEFLKTTETPVKIATKFMPYPWRLGRGSLLSALRGSLSRLGRTKVALYLVHQPLPPVRVETWMEAMAEAFQAGMIEAIGVSNFDRSRTQRAYDALTRSGISLAANQVEYSLLNRGIEKNGLLEFCRELGITVIAHSPLAKGVLSGKYTPQNPLRGVRSTQYTPGFLARAQNLINQLKKIGSDHGGKTAGQVALNWTICKGTIPIPGAKNLQQAEQNMGAGGWSLTEGEVSLLDEMSDRVNK
ncbi:MAG TPA: aldo/keto reductase [Anaerolineaceae bacterium]|nr:aldo/keto reductase [Anaerolineaceae bacterium]